MKNLPCSLLLVSLCIGLSSCASDSISKDVVLKKYERKFDLTSQLVKIVHKITIENIGSNPVKYFLFVLTDEEHNKLSYIGAQVGSFSLGTTETTIANHPGYHFYRVDLRDVLQAGKTSSVIDVDVVLVDSLQPFPVEIQQGEKQLVVYEGSHWVSAAYPVAMQTTTVTLPSPNIETYSKLTPTSVSDATITYGPYDMTAAFSRDPMKVHYEASMPFVTITSMERILEISHWGNIAVEETIDMLHTGAKLKGSFSRYDYQRDHNTHTAVKSFRSILPAAARDVYYRDEIGNISTSHLRVKEDSVEVDLRPRFPLFGGWKTHYKIGYNVPSYEYLYYKGEEFALRMRLLDHIFDDMVVQDLTVTIILPEGSKDIDISLPYHVERLADYTHATYLDTVGRPVITLRSVRPLTAHHIQDFVVRYNFRGLLMLQEPILVVAAFMALFLVVMVWVRLDLTLSPDRATEASMRVSSNCSLVATRHHRRAGHYQAMMAEILKQQGHGNPPNALTQFTTNIKKLQQLVKDETAAIGELHHKIKADGSADMADRVTELQKADKDVRDVVAQQCTNMEKLLSRKLAKQAYADQDTMLEKKRDEAMARVKALVALL